MSEKQEFVVRVPRETKKQFNVLHFNAALNIDVKKFKNCKMERETLMKDVKEELEEEKPEFGAGSEFGRKEREEAKRRKYERRKSKHNNSPWILKVGGKGGKNLRYRGIREGGVTENASYYVFFQAPDGAFEAFPVSEWYKFTPFGRYKALSAEEAEERFSKRDQIMNYFQLKKLGTKDGERSTDELKTKKERAIKKEFKVSDMDDWYNSENENLSENSDEEKPKPKGKGKKKEKRKKDDSDNDDEEPGEDSDEGDYDDKEVDYMSDNSSSSSESDNEKHDIKGVADETALRDLVVSEDEEEGENKEENAEQIDEIKPNEDEKKVKNEDNGSLSGSDFDSDNPDDLDVSKSALFIQNRKLQKSKVADKGESTSNDTRSPNAKATPTAAEEAKNGSAGLKFKHKLENPGPGPSHTHKKQKVDATKNELTDSIAEDVRRYLLRKPYTAIELLKMCRNKMPNKRDKLAEIMTEVLKKLNPEKRKDHNGKLTFFLKAK